MQKEPKPINVGDKVRWKQMPSALAVVTQIIGHERFEIRFETDGPLKGQKLPVNRAALMEVTVLDEIAIEGTETADPWFRKKKPED